MPGFGQQERSYSSSQQCQTARLISDASEVNELGYETASSTTRAGPLAHRLPLYQASRQLPLGGFLCYRKK